MTDTAADVAARLIAARLDPFATDIPDTCDLHLAGGGTPALVTLGLAPQVAAAIDAEEQGTHITVWDLTSESWWVVSVGSPLAAYRLTARPASAEEAADADSAVADAPDPAPEAEAAPEPEETRLNVTGDWGPDAYAPGAVGAIYGVLYAGNHTPIPAGTVYGPAGLVRLDLDADQFATIDPNEPAEHRGIIDRRTGARWQVTSTADGVTGYRVTPELGMAPADTPETPREAPETPTEAHAGLGAGTQADPNGLGAVVEDVHGRLFLRHCPHDCRDDGLCIPWTRVGWGSTHEWGEVTASGPVRVHWEGLQDPAPAACYDVELPDVPGSGDKPRPPVADTAAGSLLAAAEALETAARHLRETV